MDRMHSTPPNRIRVVWDYGDWRAEEVWGATQYQVIDTFPTKKEALRRARHAAEVYRVPINVYRKNETPSIQDPQRTIKKYVD